MCLYENTYISEHFFWIKLGVQLAGDFKMLENLPLIYTVATASESCGCKSRDISIMVLHTPGIKILYNHVYSPSRYIKQVIPMADSSVRKSLRVKKKEILIKI